MHTPTAHTHNGVPPIFPTPSISYQDALCPPLGCHSPTSMHHLPNEASPYLPTPAPNRCHPKSKLIILQKIPFLEDLFQQTGLKYRIHSIAYTKIPSIVKTTILALAIESLHQISGRFDILNEVNPSIATVLDYTTITRSIIFVYIFMILSFLRTHFCA